MIVIEQSQIGGMNQVYVILFHIKVLNCRNHAKKVLKNLLPKYASIANPIDLTGDATSERYKKTLDAVFKDGNIAGVVLVVLLQIPTLDDNVLTVIRDCKIYGKPFTVCMMGSQWTQERTRKLQEFGVPVCGVVYNSIDHARYEFNDSPDDYLLYLSRLNKEKGVLTAIEVARAAGQKLIVAGNSAGNAEWSFFLHEIQPRLNSENISFRGQVNFREKVELLKNAKALLFPIDRQEPFGLVMIEAMACGTPAIGFRKGSVPEIIEHGKTGFVADTPEEMVEAIKNIATIDRHECRKTVEEKFTLKQMVDKYEKIYEKLA